MKTFLQISFFIFLLIQICFAQGSWTQIGDMPEIRYGHTVNELNGKIYVVGGLNTEFGVSPRTALVYDRSSSEWDTISLYNNKIRWAHTSSVVDGKLYVMGGNDSTRTIPTMDMFDPNTGQWESKDSMSIDRGLGASATIDGKIYVMGGMRVVGGIFYWDGLKTVEAYDINTGQWTSKADMPTKRWGHSAAAYNGKIYVVGGRSAGAPYLSIEVYDPQFNTWETVSNCTIPTRRYCLTTCVLDSNIYAIGGWYNSGGGPIYDKVEVYNPESNTWYTETPMPVALCTPSIVLDGKIYVYGGTCTTHPLIGSSGIYEFSYDDIFALQPYLDKMYAKENIDSVLFRTRFSNIYNHPFTPHLIYANLDSTQIDSLTLFDDGLHGDSLVSDGLYGAYIPPRTIEDFFTLSISTIDNQTNKYYNTPDRCRFTTVGPVTLDSVYVQDQSTYFFVKPLLKNYSTVTTITNASVRLICNDPWVASILPSIRDLPDIPPGAVVGPSSMFRVDVDTTIFPGYFNFKVEVTSNDWAYWTDSMRVPPIAVISINPTELDFGEVAMDSSATMTFTITNYGDEDLIISNITSSEPVFTVNITNAVILPDSSQDVEVTFTPTGLLSFNGKIEITHNAAGSPDSVVVTGEGVTEVEEELQPLTFSLEQNYPNPFNPVTTIKYSIPEISKVMLKLFNLLGEEVVTLVNEEKIAGYYMVEFNAANLRSGVYFYQLKATPNGGQAGSFVETKKMILLK